VNPLRPTSWLAAAAVPVRRESPGRICDSSPASCRRRLGGPAVWAVLLVAACTWYAVGDDAHGAERGLGTGSPESATPPEAAASQAPVGVLPAERAANYEQALALASATGRDIVVFQRGSDWNRLAETLYQRVWLSDELAAQLGQPYILVAVDHPEEPGGEPLEPIVPGELTGRDRPAERRKVGTAPSRLGQRCQDDAALPASQLTTVASEGEATFVPREDGAWLAQGAANPAHDTLTLHVHADPGGQLLRLDFPTDPSLPGSGPGRASNGNFAISEVEVEIAGRPVRLKAAWASAFEGVWGPWQAIDAIRGDGDNLWNAMGHQHERRTLLVVMDPPAPAGAELRVRLVCRSKWGQHVPGCVRAAVLTDPALADDVRRAGRAEQELAANRKFTWWDTSLCPRIALFGP